ncbi:NTF2 domain-containing protein [Mycena indigotica]|uniref:NTF2 domain-containing protein n=1 Tax=Mycena indigotica TaxID=2126181 RepID=A0A8H6S286_9AGAR|nr:NTF2 domain-containing protein [Mycena indigotica]KAF7289975.1 NTF2 domain-containing protein [Mycena indigotica]
MPSKRPASHSPAGERRPKRQQTSSPPEEGEVNDDRPKLPPTLPPKPAHAGLPPKPSTDSRTKIPFPFKKKNAQPAPMQNNVFEQFETRREDDRRATREIEQRKPTMRGGDHWESSRYRGRRSPSPRRRSRSPYHNHNRGRSRYDDRSYRARDNHYRPSDQYRPISPHSHQYRPISPHSHSSPRHPPPQPAHSPPPPPPPDIRLNNPLPPKPPPPISPPRKQPPEIRKEVARTTRRTPPPRRSQQAEEIAYGRTFKGCGNQYDYEITTKLGEGTFGEVHKAHHPASNSLVALKRILMHNEKEGMPVTALREIKILKALNHSCIVNILDMFVVRSTSKDPLSVYMVFPYMDHDLAGLLENERVKLQPSQIKLYMKQLLEGTEYMHRNHILHRDMKAANLLINNQGTLLIADFGLARAFDSGDNPNRGHKERKYTNCVVTRWYRPPELLLGARHYGGEVDMWGIGCVLGEMFMRRPILPGTSDVDQLEKIFMLCGSPNQHTWPNFDVLPGCEGIKGYGQHHRKIKTTFEHIGSETVDLLEQLLICNPRQRITASAALDHDYFWTDPLPADPKTLPRYDASHEFDKRAHRQPPQAPQPPYIPPTYTGDRNSRPGTWSRPQQARQHEPSRPRRDDRQRLNLALPARPQGIFELAADEDVIFHHALPTSMAESAWFRDVNGTWQLRSPQEAIEEVQRRSYGTKRAIIQTSKKWREIGSQFLFRCLFFDSPEQLVECHVALESYIATTSTQSLGWWTRRIHITRRVFSQQNTNTEPLRDVLAGIIQHCPNLEMFLLDSAVGSTTLGPIVDALATFSTKSLRTFGVTVLSPALPRLIWALDSLRHLFAVQVQVDLRGVDTLYDETPLGAAHDIQLRLPNLRQLSVRGHIQQLVEQATGWQMPSLRFFSIHTTESLDLPDVQGFLANHGSALHFLDVYLTARQSLPQILAACPSLNTLVFNGDWRIVGVEDDSASNPLPLAHTSLVNVGMHQLFRAFGFDPAIDKMAQEGATNLPVDIDLTLSYNDRTLDALVKRPDFPSLARIRAVDPQLLRELNVANGPKEQGGGMERWEQWWDKTAVAGVRLEDCTGNLLGELPQDDAEVVEEEDSFESWDDDDDYYSQPGSRRVSNLDELKELLEECRAMDLERDDDYLHQSPEMHLLKTRDFLVGHLQ